MKRAILTFAVVSACPLLAQQDQPPRVIRIFREEIKPGRGAAHEKAEAGYVRAFTRHNFPVHYIALRAMAGPSEAWFAEAHDSFEAIESAERQIEKSSLKGELDMLDAQDGELRASNRTILASYREDLSYRPSKACEMLPKSRFVMVNQYRVRTGKEMDFVNLAKMAIAANEKSDSDMPTMVYQVVSGMPFGTYLMFAPMQSMKTFDGGPARSKAWLQALEDGPEKFFKAVSDTVLFGESSLFALEPKMSYVSKDFAAADPEFWAPKPKPATAKKAEPKAESADRARK